MHSLIFHLPPPPRTCTPKVHAAWCRKPRAGLKARGALGWCLRWWLIRRKERGEGGRELRRGCGRQRRAEGAGAPSTNRVRSAATWGYLVIRHVSRVRGSGLYDASSTPIWCAERSTGLDLFPEGVEPSASSVLESDYLYYFDYST